MSMSICGFSNPFLSALHSVKSSRRGTTSISITPCRAYFCSDVDYATGSYFDFRGLRLSDGRLLDIPPGSWYPVSLAPRNLILTVKSQVDGAVVEWREGGGCIRSCAVVTNCLNILPFWPHLILLRGNRTYTRGGKKS